MTSGEHPRQTGALSGNWDSRWLLGGVGALAVIPGVGGGGAIAAEVIEIKDPS